MSGWLIPVTLNPTMEEREEQLGTEEMSPPPQSPFFYEDLISPVFAKGFLRITELLAIGRSLSMPVGGGD